MYMKKYLYISSAITVPIVFIGLLIGFVNSDVYVSIEIAARFIVKIFSAAGGAAAFFAFRVTGWIIGQGLVSIGDKRKYKIDKVIYYIIILPAVFLFISCGLIQPVLGDILSNPNMIRAFFGLAGILMTIVTSLLYTLLLYCLFLIMCIAYADTYIMLIIKKFAKNKDIRNKNTEVSPEENK